MMNCNTFKSKLNDFIEGNISYDLKDAMLQHAAECEMCKKTQEGEVVIDKNFKRTLKNEEIVFNSSRSDIIKSIDKKRYSKSFLNKLYYHTKRFKTAYAGSIAIVICFVFILDYSKAYYLKETGNKSADIIYNHKESQASQVEGKKETVSLPENTPKTVEQSDISKSEIAENSSAVKNENIYLPRFTRINLDTSFQVDTKKNSTSFKESLNKKYRASIIGKGAQAQEEGVGKIYIEDMVSAEKWTFDLVQDTKKVTPKEIKWLDDENLLVIIGEAYGTITKGGKLYLLNTKTMKLCEADSTNQAKLDDNIGNEIVSVLSVKDNSIEVLVNVYDDDNFINSHSETRTISVSIADLKNQVNTK